MHTFRVGGVPEHFNEPWKWGIETGRFAARDLDVSWHDHPGGTGALLASLADGSIDLGLVLTEGVVRAASNGADVWVLGTFVVSPLVWGIHVPAASRFASVDDLEGARFAISRPNSGSHVMTYVEASRRGWPSDALSFVEVGSLDGARAAFSEGRADAFLWEKYTTKPLVDAGEWRRVGTCPTPWPSFVLACTESTLERAEAPLRELVDTVAGCTTAFAERPEFATEWIAERHGQRPDDVAEWLGETRWAPQLGISCALLDACARTLHRVGAIESVPPGRQLVPAQYATP